MRINSYINDSYHNLAIVNDCIGPVDDEAFRDLITQQADRFTCDQSGNIRAIDGKRVISGQCVHRLLPTTITIQVPNITQDGAVKLRRSVKGWADRIPFGVTYSTPHTDQPKSYEIKATACIETAVNAHRWERAIFSINKIAARVREQYSAVTTRREELEEMEALAIKKGWGYHHMIMDDGLSVSLYAGVINPVRFATMQELVDWFTE